MEERVDRDAKRTECRQVQQKDREGKRNERKKCKKHGQSKKVNTQTAQTGRKKETKNADGNTDAEETEPGTGEHINQENKGESR